MDLLHIPGDTGNGWRIRKFAEYAHKIRAVDPLFMEGYYRRHKLSLDDTLRLFWLLSATYSEITAVVIFNDIKNFVGWNRLTPDIVDRYWWNNRDNLCFGSSRRYARNMNWFPYLLSDFIEFTKGDPAEWFKTFLRKRSPQEAYNNLFQYLVQRKFVGRFGAESFLISFPYFFLDNLWNINLKEHVTYDWRKYANETSGLLNLFYLDELADNFDKTKSLSNETIDFLNNANKALRTYLKQEYGDYDAQPLIYMPKLCSFRNLCKQRRYGGFHHDRQLRFILTYKKRYGESAMIRDMFEIRKEIYPNELLGELHDWTNIRPKLMKQFVNEGLTGAERITSIT